MASPSQSTISNSSSTPTSGSTSTVTPASYAASTTPSTATTSRRPYPLSASQLDVEEKAIKVTGVTGSQLGTGVGTTATPDGEPEGKRSRIPVTPAVLRAIFASSRSPGEERSMSRVAFFRFSGFLLSCLVISLVANRGRSIRGGAALLGVGI
ncbi:hypothetical protein PENSPDRAFT_604848 [Peniophora sp. CONT]|nr:hypothetical protein PENSPDRAFT_604848 [Peniophora sp. CONT]